MDENGKKNKLQEKLDRGYKYKINLFETIYYKGLLHAALYSYMFCYRVRCRTSNTSGFISLLGTVYVMMRLLHVMGVNIVKVRIIQKAEPESLQQSEKH